MRSGKLRILAGLCAIGLAIPAQGGNPPESDESLVNRALAQGALEIRAGGAQPPYAGTTPPAAPGTPPTGSHPFASSFHGVPSSGGSPWTAVYPPGATGGYFPYMGSYRGMGVDERGRPVWYSGGGAVWHGGPPRNMPW